MSVRLRYSRLLVERSQLQMVIEKMAKLIVTGSTLYAPSDLEALRDDLAQMDREIRNIEASVVLS